MAHILIDPTTSAVNTQAPFAVGKERLPCTLKATGLGAGEEAAVHFSVDGGSSWEELWIDGVQVKLTDTNNAQAIQSIMLIGVTKSATAASSGVYISAADNI